MDYKEGRKEKVMKAKVILFDLDDTLIHFEDYWKVSILETFRKHHSTQGIEPSEFFTAYLRQNGIYEDKYHRQEITLQQFRNYRLIQALLEFDREIGENIADDFNKLHKEISKTYMRARPSLIKLLQDIKENYLIGIVTNGIANWQYDKLDSIGIRELFSNEAIIISDEVGYEKPHPEIYLKALELFQVSAEEVIFIGDSWKNDVEGPANLGIRSIWLNKKNEYVHDNSKLMGVVSDLLEIKRLLNVAE
jgi:HAD superfamily hydrolase (TIGR01509 family)